MEPHDTIRSEQTVEFVLIVRVDGIEIFREYYPDSLELGKALPRADKELAAFEELREPDA